MQGMDVPRKLYISVEGMTKSDRFIPKASNKCRLYQIKLQTSFHQRHGFETLRQDVFRVTYMLIT
jgi:hypothetical protein